VLSLLTPSARPASISMPCSVDWNPPIGNQSACIGPGVNEIRIHVRGEWRVIYVAKFAEAVYVLHAFQKKTQKTRREDIELAQRRYRQIGE